MTYMKSGRSIGIWVVTEIAIVFGLLSIKSVDRFYLLMVPHE